MIRCHFLVHYSSEFFVDKGDNRFHHLGTLGFVDTHLNKKTFQIIILNPVRY